MITYRCRKCTWWDQQHPAAALVPKVPGKGELGFCRKHKPGAERIGSHYYGVQPATDADEFCGEFREDPNGLSN